MTRAHLGEPWGPRLLAAVCVLFSTAPDALAGGEQTVLVLEFGGKTSGPFSDAPQALTETMTEVVRESGSEANQTSREDVIALAGCADASDDCLRQAVGLLDVREAVTGDVREADGKLIVELRSVRADGEPRARAVELPVGSTAEARTSFRAEAAAFLRDEPSPAEAAAVVPEPATTAPAEVTAATPVDDGADGFSPGRVRPYAWAIAGSGVGMVLLGSAFLFIANDRQSEVDAAPTDTVEDLESLVDLEASGRRYGRVGSAFVIVGAVAAVAGGVLIYRQGKNGSGERSLAIAPSASPDGFGVTLTLLE